MKRKTLAMAMGLALIFFGAIAGAQGEKDTETVQRAVFQVKNLSCGACLTKINSALTPEKGFSGMGANLFRGMVAVDFTAPLTPEKIGGIISGLGYPASLDSVESLTEKQTFAYMRSLRQGQGYGGSCCGAGGTASAQCPGASSGCPVSSDAGGNDTGKDI